MAESLPSARLAVRPGPPLTGSFVPPGDKSITHRAYLLGLVAAGMTVVENPNPGADCEATLACAAVLGARVTRAPGSVTLQGCAGTLREPDRILDCGNSGTTLRLLAGVLAGQPFLSILAGDASLHRRPVSRVVVPLRAMGAQVWARDQDRLPPLVIRGGALRAANHRVEVASAQVASCLLLAGLFATGRTEVTLPTPARDHTQRMLSAFGVPVTGPDGAAGTVSGSSFSVRGPVIPTGIRLRVPGDLSGAAFFLAAAATSPGASVTARGVNLNPTRSGLLAILERMGASVERTGMRDEGGEPLGDVTVTGPRRLRAATIAAEEVPALIDEIPAWAIAAAGADGTSRLSGAGELRVKESDRLASLAMNLGRLGIVVEESQDGLAITGGPVRGGDVDAAGDHRIAMALALLGTRAAGPVNIDGAGGIATSYPGFAASLVALGGALAGSPAEGGR